MQEASAEFDNAISGEIVWAPPTLLVGWHGYPPSPPSVQSQGYWEDYFDRTAPDSWVETTRYTWDAGVEGWVGEGSTSVAMETGFLKATNTLGPGVGSVRFNDAQGIRNLSSGGPTLRVMAMLPPGTPGTDWLARIEVQDSGFGWHGGPDTYIVPGVWLELRYTPPPELLANMRAIGIQFIATGVNATVDAYVDSMVQFWPEPDALWTSTTPTLLDVAPGVATISNNVVNSTRGVLYDLKDSAGDYFLADWEVFAVFSADVLPAGAPYAWIMRFQGATSDEWLDLWINVQLATGLVYYQQFRNYTPGLFETLVSTTYVPALTYVAGKKLAARWARSGDQILINVWDYDADEEPQEWLTIATDPHPFFTGAPQLRSNLHAGNTNGTVTFSFHRFALKDMRWTGDLTNQLGDEYAVQHSMDDGMPSAVSGSLAGEPQAGLGAALSGRRVGDRELDARQYFSPFNTSSLVYGYARDIAPVELEHGLFTENGQELIRLFTGQMANIAIRGRGAELQAISSTRLKLARGVQPPIVNGPVEGAEVTWLANYLLWACGVHVAPPANLDTCQIYIPGAGSMRPYLPFAQGTTSISSFLEPNMPGVGSIRPTFTDGPFLRAIGSSVSQGYGPLYHYNAIGFRHREDGVGVHYLTRDNPRGRMEFWLLGVTEDPEIDSPFSAPGRGLAYFRLPNGAATRVQLTVAEDRQLHWQVSDWGQPIRRFWTGLTLPADNQWHAVGMFYDLAANDFRVHVDGDERTWAPSPAFTLSDFETVDDGVTAPQFWSAIPYAEIRLHTGTNVQLDPAVVGWDAQLTRIDGAVLAYEDWEDTTYAVTWSGGWARANDQAYAGTWSLKSAAILDYGFSGFLLTLPANTAEVEFRIRLSTELTDDVLRVWTMFLYHTFSSVASNGWGTPDVGPAFGLIGSASDYSANGFVGQQALNSVNVERAAYVDTGANDGEIQSDVNFGVATATGGPLRIRLRGRGTGADTNNNYYAELELGTDGFVRASISTRVNGSIATVVPATVIGSNGTGATWRFNFAWSGTRLRATTFNISTPGSPVVLETNAEGLSEGERVYFGSTRAVGNTNVTTVTFDNVMVNGITLYGGSGPVDSWHQVRIKVPSGITKLLFRYEKDMVSTGGSDAVWIDELRLRESPTITSSWASQVVMRGIEMELEAIAEDSHREAWSWLAEICQSTLTNMRVDELDRMMVLPPRYFAEAEQLIVRDVLTTEWNAQDPDITLDPSRIRNSVQVDFKETIVDTAYINVLEFKTVLAIPRGVHRVEFTLDVPAVVLVEDLTPQYWTITPPGTPAANVSSVYANTNSEGTGTRLSSDDFTARVVEWTAQTAIVEFDNKTTANAYLVHDLQDDTPYLSIAGKGVHVQDSSASVQAVQAGRPERTVTVQAPAVQTRQAARELAAALLVWTGRPRAEVSLKVMGDPRRQPGDLYELQDAEGTKMSGHWRPLSITHNRIGAQFTQDIVLRESLPVAKWDDNSAGWDEGVWS